MGNLKSHQIKSHLIKQDGNEYPFVGREKDISKIHELLKSNRVIQIHGLQEIGTSRVMKQVIMKMEKKCLYKDFSLDTGSFGTNGFPNVLLELTEELQQNKENGAKAFGELSFKDALNVIMKDAAKPGEDVVLFLDNVNAVKNEAFTECLKEFLHAVVKQATSLKVVFTSSPKLRMATNGFISHKIKEMNNEEIRQLLFDSILESKRKAMVCNDDADDDDLNNFLDDLKIEKNKKFMDVLINLCFGLPKLAMMTVSLLTDYDCLLEPKDLIVLMIEDNLNTLSPDCYPSQDRADTYKEVIKELKTRREQLLLFRINRQMDEDNSASVNTVITCVPDAKSSAHAKQAATPLLDHNVMSYNIKKKEFDMIHILRECCLAMDPLDEGNKEELQKDLKEALIKSTQLDVPDNVANSPRELEKYLESLEESYIKSQQQKQTDPTNKEDATTETKENNEFQLPYSAETIIHQHTNDLSCNSLSGPSAMSYSNLPSDDIDGNIHSEEDNTILINLGTISCGHIKPRPSDKSGDHNKKGDPIPAPITEHGAANPREQGSYGETSKVPTDEHGASKPKEQDNHGAYNQKEQDNHVAYQPRDQNIHDAYNQMEQDTHGAYKQRDQNNHGAYNLIEQDIHCAYKPRDQDNHGAYNQMEQDNHSAYKGRDQNSHGAYNQMEQDNHGAYKRRDHNYHDAYKPMDQNNHGCTELTDTGWKFKSTDVDDLGQLKFDKMMLDNGVKPEHDPNTLNGQKGILEDDMFHKLNLGMEGYQAEQKTLNDSD